MSKKKDQLIARTLQAETGCSYMTALRKVRERGQALTDAGKAWSEAMDEVALLTPEELGLR